MDPGLGVVLTAHGPAGAQGVEWIWFAEPVSASILALAGVLYLSGWRRAVSTGRDVPLWEPALFVIGWTVVGLALLSPVHTAGETMLSIHMLQHSHLILGPAALVAGRTQVRILQGLPVPWRGRLIKPVRHLASVRLPFWGVAGLLIATVILWHVPAVFELAARDPMLHAIEHASLILVAMMYWNRVIGPRSVSAHTGAHLLSLFVMAVLGAGLGAVLTFATVPWYPDTAARSTEAGLDWLSDQQLAGVAMTVPMGVVFMGVAARLGWVLSGAERWSVARTTRHAEMSTSAATTPNKTAR